MTKRVRIAGHKTERSHAASLLAVMAGIGGAFGPSGVSEYARQPKPVDLEKQAQKRAARDARLRARVESGKVQVTTIQPQALKHEYVEKVLKENKHGSVRESTVLRHSPVCARCKTERGQ